MVMLRVNEIVTIMEAMCQNTGSDASISPVMQALFSVFVIASSLHIKFSSPAFDFEWYVVDP